MFCFPNESQDYRQARDQLLEAERALRDQVERVAQQRRALPPGGLLKEDYRFDELGPDGTPRRVSLSALFGHHDTLMLYSFMYSPDMASACPMCTTFLDGVSANTRPLAQKLALAVVAASPIVRLSQFARGRAWDLRLLSSASNTYNADYHGQGEWEGRPSQLPMLNVFHRSGSEIRHFWASELQQFLSPSGNPRHLDQFWALWNLLDLTPDGRGSDFYPRLTYD